jgi:hypothetical protein
LGARDIPPRDYLIRAPEPGKKKKVSCKHWRTRQASDPWKKYFILLLFFIYFNFYILSKLLAKSTPPIPKKKEKTILPVR